MKQLVFSKLPFILILGSLLLGCRDNGISDPDQSYLFVDPVNFEITAPVFGSRWDMGTTNEILWVPFTRIEKVDILLYKKSEFIMTIADGVPNTGKLTWTVPMDLPYTSHHYLIKVINPFNEKVLLESEQFYVFN
ncbi:MAG: GPI anchored serine-threonine rich family protein [Bacteroidetes bacterium]|nr:GPI anchored serine-threonine rich family protein [Bacteroidota bacterium]